MPVPEMQVVLFDNATTAGPSNSVNITKSPFQWFVLTVHADNAVVQLESSQADVEGSYLPIVASPPSINPLSLVGASSYILYFGCAKFIRARINQITSGTVTAVLQGFPWNWANAPVGIQGLVGLPNNPLVTGSFAYPRLGMLGELQVGQLLPEYYEAVKTGKVFIAAHQATQALSVNSTTATGLILSNPEGSPVNLVILEIAVAIASLPAAQYNLILTGQPTLSTTLNPVAHTTALPIRNALMGSQAVAYGKADAAATLPAALIQRIVGAGGAATQAGSTAFPPFIRDPVNGLVVLGPGTCTSLQALTTAVTVVAHIVWQEIPI